jgi:peptidylprolyl isomerase
MKKNQPTRSITPVSFESLENRQLLSSTAVATTTSLTLSSRKTELGAPITIKATVSSSAGIPKGGTVELLLDNKTSGLTGTLNHLGYYTFTLDAADALYVGTTNFRIRFLSEGNFTGSLSRSLADKISPPAKFTTSSDGLELANVVATKGAAPATGDMVTVEYTGYNIANGQLFDDSKKDGQDFTFTIGANEVVTGFEEEVKAMKVGETDVAILPESIAYPTGSSSSLAGDTLVFIVKLLSV